MFENYSLIYRHNCHVTFQVGKLFQGNSYLIRVTAENRVGTGDPCMTKQAIVAKLPYGK